MVRGCEREWREGGRGEEGNDGGGRGEEWRERGRSDGGRGQGREGNLKGCTLRRTLASIHYAAHKTTHNMALALETLLLQIENDERVYVVWCVVKYCLTGG